VIKLAVLKTTPFDLIEGDHVLAKVSATNSYGESSYSPVGNGATIWVEPDAPVALANNAEVTNANEIAVTWQEGVNNGGTEVLDFRLWYTLESANSFVVLVEGLTVEYYTTIVALVDGENYKFKVQARNAVGFGAFSSEVVIRAAKVPEMPISVQTSVELSSVVISWTPDYDGGSPIIAYQIVIRESDGLTFTEDASNCDGSSAQVVVDLECTVPISVLKESPYSLEWGASVYAKVKAINVVGDSEWSIEANGAVILTVPTPPQSLSNNVAVTNKDQIGLTWYEGPDTSGTPVIDFRIWYTTVEANNYEVLVSDNVPRYYTVSPLIAGTSYKFKV
jgi:hypothetical protein